MAAAFVQSRSASFAASASARTLAYTSAVTAGNFLAVAVTSSTSTVTVAVTDSLGQTFTQADGYIYNGSGSAPARISIWYFAATAGGANTVTVTPSGTCSMAIGLLEYSGVATTSPLHAVSAGGSGSSTAPATGVVTASTGELVIAAFGSRSLSPGATTVGAPFSQRELSNTVPGLGLGDDVNAAGSEGATWTTTNATDWAALAASFSLAMVTLGPRIPEISQGPPIFGAPWRRFPVIDYQKRQEAPPPPPAQSTFAPEITFGPPIAGPWFPRRMFVEPFATRAPQIIVPPPSPPIHAPEIHAGPPMRGAPWLARLPRQEQPWTFGAQVSQARPSVFRPFIGRVPSEDRRLARFSEQVSAMLNSLFAQGYIRITDQDPLTFQILSGALVYNRPPTANDDAASGVTIGSIWVDTTAQRVWVCLDSTIGGALWRGPI